MTKQNHNSWTWQPFSAFLGDCSRFFLFFFCCCCCISFKLNTQHLTYINHHSQSYLRFRSLYAPLSNMNGQINPTNNINTERSKENEEKIVYVTLIRIRISYSVKMETSIETESIFRQSVAQRFTLAISHRTRQTLVAIFAFKNVN